MSRGYYKEMRYLQPGDEIRVIAPSMNWSAKRQRSYDRAKEALEELGFTVTFGKRVSSSELGRARGSGEKESCTSWSSTKLMPMVASSGAICA